MFGKVYNKTLLQLFFALLLVALVMFLSNYIVFRNSMTGMYTQVNENNKLVVNNIIRSFDQCFKEMNNIIDAINVLPYEAYDTEGHKNLNMFNVYMIEKNVGILASPYDYIEIVIIHFGGSDLAITSKGTMDFNVIFNKKYNNTKFAPEFWENFAVTRHPLRLIPSEYYTELERDNFTSNIYRRKLLGVVGSNQISRSKMNILLLINTDKLLKIVNQENMMKGTSLIVLDQDKNVILNTGENYDLNNFESIYFGSGNETTIKTGKYEYNCVKSNYNDFIYINKIPYRYRDAFETIKINQIILIITFIFGIIIAAILSLYLYKPLYKILNLFGVRGNNEIHNKYKQIYSSIEQIKKENEFFKTQISSVEQEIQRSVFFKMIDDITYYKNLKSQIDTYFGIIFKNKQFFMVSFLLEPIDILEKRKNSGQYSLLSEDAVALIQEFLNIRFDHSIVFHIENLQFIALIGVKQPIKKVVILELINMVINDLKKTVICEYNMAIAVSKTYSDFQDCKTAFFDIKMCMSSRNIKLINNIIDVEKIDYNSEMYFPVDLVEKISNYILCGNGKDSMDTINQIVTKNMENNVSYFKFINVVTNIFNNIINTLVFYGYEKNEILKMEQKFFEKINNFKNYEDIKSFLNDVIKQVTEKIQSKNQSKLNKDFIVQYINLHYTENLYLENIAEILDTSPKYFSNYFKRVFGINFIEYLNKVRVSHAKEYLKNSNVQIGEIGEKVGYANSSTFTSTFKKYCGISPSEYRKEYKPN